MFDGEPAAWIARDYGLMRVIVDRPTLAKRKFELYPSRILTADGAPISVRDGKGLTLKYDDRDFQIHFGHGPPSSVGDDLYYEAKVRRNDRASVADERPPRFGGLARSMRGIICSMSRPAIATEKRAKSTRLAFIIRPALVSYLGPSGWILFGGC